MATNVISQILSDDEVTKYLENEITIEELKSRYRMIMKSFHCSIQLTNEDGEEVVVIPYP